MSRRRLVYSFLTVVFVLFLSTSAFAAGFALYEGSARGNVLGAGLTASADDPSAVFYNPAGITQLKGTQTMFGATFIYPKTDVSTRGSITGSPLTGGYSVTGSQEADSTTADNWWIPPHFYLTHQLNDKWYTGVGIFSRFGLGTEFDAGWPGRYNSYYVRIRTTEINPNIAYKVNDKFSLAGGLNVMWFDLKMHQSINTPAGNVDQELKGDSWGWGFNLAAQYKPTEEWALGISYRSRVSQNIQEGEATYRRPDPYTAAGLFPNMKVEGGLHLPDEVFAGVAWKVVPTVTLGGGIYWTRWSSFDKLQFTFAAPQVPGGPRTITKAKEWEDVYRFMVGGEWKFMPNWRASLSYAYDQSPINDKTADYLLPANDRNMFSAGLGYDYGKWTTDFSYTLILISARTVEARPSDGILPSEYKNGIAHLFGISLGYKF